MTLTGEQLYAVYLKAHDMQGVGVDPWEHLDEIDQKSWQCVADATNQRHIAWVVERWKAEVASRPLVNVHRRSLDDTWRQVLRHLGVDDRERLGPTHDELVARDGVPNVRES